MLSLLIAMLRTAKPAKNKHYSMMLKKPRSAGFFFGYCLVRLRSVRCVSADNAGADGVPPHIYGGSAHI